MCVCLKKLARIHKAVQASQVKSCVASDIIDHHKMLERCTCQMHLNCIIAFM